MSNNMIIQVMQETYDGLEQKIRQIETYLKNTPEGYLKVRERNHVFSYFQVTRNNRTDNNIEVHALRKTEPREYQIILQLAHKHYYQRLLPVIKNEHYLIKKFLDRYDPDKKYQIYDNLNLGRKAIVRPVFFREKEKIHRFIEEWRNEKWAKNERYPERLIYETNRGELVRSKSEIIIADQLYMNQDICIYRYEAPLVIHNVTIYPDFTIVKISTGEIFYWEHFGMMDDEEYVNRALKKINDYIHAGIYPGKQLICTFESQKQPLDTKTVKKLIQEYFSN